MAGMQGSRLVIGLRRGLGQIHGQTVEVSQTAISSDKLSSQRRYLQYGLGRCTRNLLHLAAGLKEGLTDMARHLGLDMARWLDGLKEYPNKRTGNKRAIRPQQYQQAFLRDNHKLQKTNIPCPISKRQTETQTKIHPMSNYKINNSNPILYLHKKHVFPSEAN